MNAKQIILSRLRSDRDIVSGTDLSRSLNMSRVSVWKHVRRLQQSGYDIEATPKGYRLIKDIDVPFAWEFPGREAAIHYFPRIDSTMVAARKLAHSGCPHFTVVVTEQQTAGRGRLNRSWHSGSGGLYFTIILRPEIPPALSPRRNLCTSLVLAEILRQTYDIPAAVKWPNDVLVDKSKIAGILAEMEAEADRVSYVNIGVDPTTNSWGNMINSARLELAREPVVWWSLAAAFTFMFLLVLSANLFADAVRDAFDPRLRNS